MRTEQQQIQDILDLARKHYRVSEGLFRSTCRRQNIIRARKAAAYLLRYNTTLSLNEIGAELRDEPMHHTTVLHLIRDVHQQIEVDESFERTINELQDEIDYTKTLPAPNRKAILRNIRKTPVVRMKFSSEHDKVINKYL